MNKKRYWLRGGVIFVGIFFLVALISIVLVSKCAIVFLGSGDSGCFGNPSFVIFLADPIGKITGNLFEAQGVYSWIYLVPNGLIWFVIGTIFGWLYGKIKK